MSMLLKEILIAVELKKLDYDTEILSSEAITCISTSPLAEKSIDDLLLLSVYKLSELLAVNDFFTNDARARQMVANELILLMRDYRKENPLPKKPEKSTNESDDDEAYVRGRCIRVYNCDAADKTFNGGVYGTLVVDAAEIYFDGTVVLDQLEIDCAGLSGFIFLGPSAKIEVDAAEDNLVVRVLPWSELKKLLKK